MEFRDLKQQYQNLKPDIDEAIKKVMEKANFISGSEVKELERQLAEYVGVKHCITCGNGTDALQLALMAWGVGPGDAVFVPDFTFFASAEVVAAVGATPVFVDILEDTFNISPESLEDAARNVVAEGKLKLKAVIAVDLFGLPADYAKIRKVASNYNMLILEDGAQGFGGAIGGRKACSFGDIGTTSFFPAKPLGCYGDGGAIFTDNDDWAGLIRSLCIHGKGEDKYDNIRIGMNSRLDTLQAAILRVKLKAFREYELDAVNQAAQIYTEMLCGLDCRRPLVADTFFSSWAQYTIILKNENSRNELQCELKRKQIPSMIYYKRGMNKQEIFRNKKVYTTLSITQKLCENVLSVPIHPYITLEEQNKVVSVIKATLG